MGQLGPFEIGAIAGCKEGEYRMSLDRQIQRIWPCYVLLTTTSSMVLDGGAAATSTSIAATFSGSMNVSGWDWWRLAVGPAQKGGVHSPSQKGEHANIRGPGFGLQAFGKTALCLLCGRIARLIRPANFSR